jgi:carbamoyltransferase
MKQPRILGINRTQDASITLFEGENHSFSIQKERLTRQRHHWGKLGDSELYLSRLEELKRPIDLIVEGYSCDKELNNMALYHKELKDIFSLTNETKIIQMSHHLSHAYSAYYPSGYSNAVVMVSDSVGSQCKNFTENYNFTEQDANKFEVASFYYMDDKEVICLHKQLWDGNKKSPKGLGQFYFLLTQCVFPGEGKEGKVMGLSKWGDPHRLNLPPLEVHEGDVFIPPEWQELFNNPEKYSFYKDKKGYFHDCADLAAAGQKAFEEALLQLTQWLAFHTDTPNLCYAGGTALNCSANGMLLRHSPFKNIFIPPAPHDGGTSLGCALYGLIDFYGIKPNFKWESDYLGPNKPMLLPSIVSPTREVSIQKPDDIYEEVSNSLLKGEVMALFLENSEFGPRALGHRSIIADPRFRVTTDWINRHVKHREWFRPIAPFVLEEELDEIFEVNCKLPYMLYAVSVKPKYRQKLSAAVHIDGTARVQSVSQQTNPFLHRLLLIYKEKIGVGVLLNTSFNRQGEPIIETFEEALDCFLNTPLHALLIPPYIIRKKNVPANPLLTSYTHSN